MKVGERIAREMQVPLGDIVGFRHRDHDTTTDDTHIEVHVDGELHLCFRFVLQYELILYRHHRGVG